MCQKNITFEVMKKILVFVLLLCSLSSFSQYTVNGGQGQPLKVKDEQYSEKTFEVYLLYGLNGSVMTYDADPLFTGTHNWYRYKISQSGAEPVPSSQTANHSQITALDTDYAYYVEINGVVQGYVWVTDYSQYLVDFYSLSAVEGEDKCSYLKLLADMSTPQIRYNFPNGAPESVQRKYTLTYKTQQWNEGLPGFETKDETRSLTGIVREILINAPLQDTKFVLKDDLAVYFGIDKKIESAEYGAVAVVSESTYVKKERNNDNEENLSPAEGDLGGSAPVDITFTAYANNPVASFYVWKIYKTADGPSNPIVRYPDEVLRYVFEASGEYKAQLEVTDKTSTCTDTSQVYTITVYDSFIDVPNVFTPATSPGVNDEFKVAYKSIAKFSCKILNRWGNMLYKWEDPALGWDGKVNGKYVPPGVYFYVIEATGSDGRKITRRGDINILRPK